MNPLMLNKTHTTKFILPMVFEDDVRYDKILTDEFVNAYIADMDVPDSDNSIIVVQRGDFIPKVTNAVLRDFYTKEDDTEVLVYDVPEKWAEDYFQFMIGSYTDFSEEYKERLLHFWDNDSDSELYKVLYKILPDNKVELELEHDIDFDSLDQLYPEPTIVNEIYNNKGDE